MKRFLTAFFCLLLMGAVYSAPPDPSEGDTEFITDEETDSFLVVGEPAVREEMLKAQEELLESLEDLKELENIDTYAIKDLEKKLQKLGKKYEGMGKVLEGIEQGLWIDELILGGDSIYIKLNNDSSFTFRYSEDLDEMASSRNDIVHFGRPITIEEDEVIEGDVVSAFGDIIVHGTVEGTVIAFSGDIYISSTGNVENGALAFSGKVKREPGSTVGAVIWGSRHVQTELREYNRSVYRTMGLIFLIIYIIWLVLSATCASLLKSNVKTVGRYIEESGIIKSYFVGYLAYFLAFLIFIGLCITILGLPLALLGVPLALLAASILSSTALSNLIGLKILNAENYSFKTFLYGNLFLGSIPGLFFLVQTITGNLTIMIFSWILIGLFLFIILPVGQGAVLSTRFGTRLRKGPLTESTTGNSSLK